MIVDEEMYKVAVRKLLGSTFIMRRKDKKVYDYIVESVEEARKEGVSPDELMDEGIFAGLLAASAGAMVGPAIGKAMCKCLGIQENGVLGNLLTSRLVIAAICGELGLNY
jgi:hypothetical protein